MTSTEDDQVLGKRGRGNGSESRDNGSEDDSARKHAATPDEESDDDVGPMPMPNVPSDSAVKKKRKGTINCPLGIGCPQEIQKLCYSSSS